MVRLTRDERQQAVGMIQAGLSYREIARRFNCAHTTIMRLDQRHIATRSVDDRRRPGRERVTSMQQDRYIVMQHLRNRFRSASTTARGTPGRRAPRISSPTVRRRLRESGLMARRPCRGLILTVQRRRNRARWCQPHLRWTQNQWKTVMFTDESRFCFNRADGRERVWRRTGERYAACSVRQADRWGGGSIMVWAGITWHFKTPLVVIDGSLTARRYIDEVLEPHVLPFLRQHPNVTLFQQDNARPHSARLTADYLHQNNVNVLPWPAYSPDLSPIEHIWDQLGQAVSRRAVRPVNRQELIHALQEEWDNIPQFRIQRLVRSMRRRCRACLDANGGHIVY